VRPFRVSSVAATLLVALADACRSKTASLPAPSESASPAASASTSAPDTPERGALVTLIDDGYHALTAGDRAHAHAAFQEAIGRLRDGEEANGNPVDEGPGAPYRSGSSSCSSSGRTCLVATRAGVFVERGDAPQLRVREAGSGVWPGPNDFFAGREVAFITAANVPSGGERILVYDFGGKGAPALLATLRSRSAPVLAPDGSAMAFVSPQIGEREQEVIVVWDVAERRVRFSTDAPGPFSFIDEGQLLLVGSTSDVSVLDAHTGRLLTRGSGSPLDATPAITGRFLATSNWNHGASDGPADGMTQLVDRQTGRVIAKATACRHPYGKAFVDAGKRLLVGDESSVCIFDVPSLRLVGRTEALCQGCITPDNDLAFVGTLEEWPEAHAFVASMADNHVGVFRTSDGHTLWNSPNRTWLPVPPESEARWIGNDRTLRASGLEPPGEVIEISPDLTVVRRHVPASDARPTVLRAPPAAPPQSCHVGDWIFPRSECD